MALLPVRIYGDPVLRTKSEPIREVDDSHLSLALDMLETMRHEEGIGLAAVQIGRPIRMLVADVGDRAPKGAPKIFINPEIVEASGEWTFDEGCLSVPGITAEIVRPKRIRLRFTDGKGEGREEVFDELLARVLQHEIDHLNGTLFVDHLEEVERAAIWKQLLELEKESRRRAPATR
ncbi:MAG: peptide deformylase [Candidatus Eisenbacteria bacterium]|nr:peptide deformylase [Candidatus Latescibacterota bacterium]MBD3301678.1 peptide deformylase [Candidatus Eisenbacteria bacterium]